MPKQFFIQRKDKVIGPFSVDEFKDLIGRGKVSGNVPVAKRPTGPWRLMTEDQLGYLLLGGQSAPEPLDKPTEVLSRVSVQLPLDTDPVREESFREQNNLKISDASFKPTPDSGSRSLVSKRKSIKELAMCPNCRMIKHFDYEHLGRRAECSCGTVFVLQVWACQACNQSLRDIELDKCPRCHATIEHRNSGESKNAVGSLPKQFSETGGVAGETIGQEDGVNTLFKEWMEALNTINANGQDGHADNGDEEIDQPRSCKGCRRDLVARAAFCHHCGASQITAKPYTHAKSRVTRRNTISCATENDDQALRSFLRDD